MKVITKTTKERNEEFEELYVQFKEIAYTTDLKKPEILKILNISQHNRLYKDMSKKWNEEEPVTLQRRGILISNKKWLEGDIQ